MSDLDIAAEHGRLVEALAAAGKPYRGDPQGNDSYSGSRHPFYFVGAPERRRLAREWLKAKPPAAQVVRPRPRAPTEALHPVGWVPGATDCRAVAGSSGTPPRRQPSLSFMANENGNVPTPMSTMAMGTKIPVMAKTAANG